ncbi:hypothetical protein [Actinoplanes sp. N902-109]|uniref:hypothetical protein n=1 Tax=Actinoplanes sp. (strain N902-109) TaxID=649831 RepID=UPI0003A375F3|nr:hypothetical protein [Actinoplanes sp. N902-109]
MAVFAVERLCHRISHDPAYRDAVRSDPVAAVAGFPPEVRAELLSGDVLALYHRGVHPVLLVRLATHRVFGLTPELYGRRITS